MRTILIGILLGVLSFLGAGAFSYSYLSQTIGSAGVVQAPSAAPASKIPSKSLNTTTTSTTPKSRAGGVVTTKTASSPKVIAPGPLRAVVPIKPRPDAILSLQGVIHYTNDARAQNGGLPALTENQTLDQDAQLKLDDMFAKQYFEHVSPTGVGPAELADRVGYAYVLVGENLALGDFAGDQDLVTAWMNSPGHRANILNAHYQEIGVAVGRGMYEGRNTWLAVQSFGMPRSACPTIDVQLKTQIDTNNATIANLKAQLDAKKAQIDSAGQNDPNYNTYVNEFNALVPQYNSAVETNRIVVANYNASVRAFNDCLNTANPHAVTQ